MLQLGTPPLELVVRSVIVYVLFLAALRVFGRREIGQFTPFDLALVLLAANAVQPAITGPDNSLLGGAIIIATLFVLNRGVAMARRQFPAVRRLLDPGAIVVGRAGAWLPDALAREGLDDDDLNGALREHGLDSVSQAKLVTLEQDGSISVVGRDRNVRMHERRRRYRHAPR
jgi:uncharacterized membrane protein YcaP (DUF421 family)